MTARSQVKFLFRVITVQNHFFSEFSDKMAERWKEEKSSIFSKFWHNVKCQCFIMVKTFRQRLGEAANDRWGVEILDV
jgi:hypothetical protein